MWIINREFRESSSDFFDICKLIISLNKNDIAEWSLGRLVDWRYGLWSTKKQEQNFFTETSRLWFTQLGELIGLSISESGNNEKFVITAEKYDFLYDEILGHLVSESRREPIEVACSMHNYAKQLALSKNGFSDIGERETTFVYSSSSIQNTSKEPPLGYQLSSMDKCTDYEGHIQLKRNAFRNDRKLESGDYFAYEHVRNSPIYDPRMDIVLINEENRIVAGCEGFIDYENQILEIERICTHSEFRRRGFARIVVAECISRGIMKNVKKIQLSSWNEQTKAFYSGYGKNRTIVKNLFRRDGA